MPLSTAVENEGTKCELLIRPDDWEHESTRRLISTEIVGDSSLVIDGTVSSSWSETSKTSAIVVPRLALERAVNARCSLPLRPPPLRNHQQRHRPDPPYRPFSLHCSHLSSHRLLCTRYILLGHPYLCTRSFLLVFTRRSGSVDKASCCSEHGRGLPTAAAAFLMETRCKNARAQGFRAR